MEVCVKRKDAAAIHVYEKAGFRDTGYTDPDTPDSLCMAWNLPETWRGDVELRLTCEADLEHVQRLWATPSVMHYVGFPEGLHETMAHLRENWLPWVRSRPSGSIGLCTRKVWATAERRTTMWTKLGLPVWM